MIKFKLIQTPNPIQIKIIQIFKHMTEQLFAINTIIHHEVHYDILMLKIKQMFAILTRTSYNLLMLKYLRSIMLKLSADKGKD